MLLSRKVKGKKVQFFREIPLSFEILDSAVHHGLENLGYQVDNAEDLDQQEKIRIIRDSLKVIDGEMKLGEVVGLPKIRGEVIRESKTLGSVTYHWMDKELGFRLAALGGLILMKKKKDLSECKLFPPPRFTNESDESYHSRHNNSFRRSVELIKYLNTEGYWPDYASTGWDLSNTFTFNANADEVCRFILNDSEQRIITLIDRNWTFEGYLSAIPTIKVMYAIGIIVNIFEGDELGRLSENSLWLVHSKDVAEIALTQEKSGECKASLYVENNSRKWDIQGKPIAMVVGHQFIGLLWNKLINEWLSQEKDFESFEIKESVKSKRGRSKFTDNEKLIALREWEKLDPSISGVTLSEYLETRFGTTGGILNVPESTFHGWRRELRKKGKYKKS